MIYTIRTIQFYTQYRRLGEEVSCYRASTCIHALMATYAYKGSEYEFVHTPTEFLNELLCPVCFELVSDPVQTSCGHLFCGSCITRTETCPVDRERFTTTLDHFNKRRLKGFKVKCPNFEEGCGWQGDLGDAEKHTEDTCPYTIHQCHNDGCNKRMQRRLIDEHMRTSCSHRWHTCPHCGKEHLNVEDNSHATICEAFPLPCPGRCGKEGLTRRDILSHLSTDCPNELVPCVYAAAGCHKAVRRWRMNLHLQDKDHHLTAVIASHIELSNTVQQLVKMYTGGQQAGQHPPAVLPPPLLFRPWLQNTPTCYRRPPWVFKMKGFQEKKEKIESWYSDPVNSHFGGYTMYLSVDINAPEDDKGTHLSVFVFLCKGSNDSNLKWPFKGTIEVSLLNQLEDDRHHTRQLWNKESDVPEDISGGAITGGIEGRGWGLSEFISQPNLGYCGDKNRQYLKDDTLFFRVDCFKPELV